MESSLEDSLACEFCRRSFGRQEHLDRHVRSHSNHRPFRCDGCHRHFSRRDTRNRHIAISCPKGGGTRARTYNSRATAACVHCSRSKIRCSTGSPCSRCQDKGLSCSYRLSKDTSGRSRVPKVSRASSIQSESPTGHDEVTRDQILPPRLSQGTDKETQKEFISSVSTGIHSSTDPFSSGHTDFRQREGMLWQIPDLPDLAHLDLLMPFEDNSFIVPESMNESSTFNPYSSREGTLENVFPQSALIDTRNSHFRSVSQLSFKPEIQGFKSEGIVRPSLWRTSRSGSPSHDGNFPLNAKIDHRTKNGHQSILISDRDILEMDDYAHVSKLTSGNAILQEMFDFIGQEQQYVLGGVDSEIPDLCDEKSINIFIQLYFEFFHPRFPMLHTPTFNTFNTTWLLVLAVVTIGSRYSRISQAQQYANFFGKYLRRAITSQVEREPRHTLRVPFIAAIILSQIDMAYSGASKLVLQSQFQRNLLGTLCRGLWGGLAKGNFTYAIENPHGSKGPYYEWLGRELAIRAVYSGWLVDCQLNVNCDISAIMSLDDFDLPLPCRENIWIMTERQWMKAFQDENLENSTSPPHMHKALTIFSQGGNDAPPMGDFARALTMVAMYQQSRVIMEAALIMSNTTPRSRLQNILNNPIYTAWRESALKSLAVLNHNSKNPMLSDLYHQLMIVVHIPLKCLCILAGWLSTEDSILESKKQLSSWMNDDPPAARTTVLHAALLFKSLRSRPLNSYIEGHALLAATLTIWAYALLHPVRPEGTLTGPIIYLDRHMDEDQERSWILYTNESSPLYISGVGCILNAGAATRVLLEARDCLARQNREWGVYNLFMSVFEAMASSGTALSLD
ncbi:hypothetical protein PMG11_10381 [Penicillium brasilianum]|uniref:C2H2 type zinc finger domain protein n=1 Tax=Penicillium brasilianum TaxID=104259 RepID=A0A0F7TYR1_PENBI|nr:hypothetical protein PMG11_10381 [Penicillium brasilianum]